MSRSDLKNIHVKFGGGEGNKDRIVWVEGYGHGLSPHL